MFAGTGAVAAETKGLGSNNDLNRVPKSCNGTELIISECDCLSSVGVGQDTLIQPLGWWQFVESWKRYRHCRVLHKQFPLLPRRRSTMAAQLSLPQELATASSPGSRKEHIMPRSAGVIQRSTSSWAARTSLRSATFRSNRHRHGRLIESSHPVDASCE